MTPQKINDYCFEFPPSGDMRVPARIIATESMLNDILSDNAPQQAMNVACLPGIVNYSWAMPDIHWGYGFPIGGVAAFDMDNGVISPGGVGYDINCGVRLLKTPFSVQDIKPRLKSLTDELFKSIPSGLGSTGSVKLSGREQKNLLKQGARWCVEQGYGVPQDLDKIEENGEMAGAEPQLVSDRALKRGRDQVGTLGSGNHFVEVGAVQTLFDENAAKVLGLEKDQVTVLIHTGSRGFGHQVCDDAIKVMLQAAQKYGIKLPDRQLCCAPIQSAEGRNYLSAMACAVNFAFANRQLITSRVRKAFEQALGIAGSEIRVVYEVAHNIAKIETHQVNGVSMKLCVHRKGATRAFGPQHPEIPADYREIGQPVLIPGDMGRYSYVLTGTSQAMQDTFGSACHGAGRVMSRTKAKKAARGRDITRELADRGIYLRSTGRSTVAEEMPDAYKDVSQVVEAVAGAGIANKVAKLKPLSVIKG
ncbi:MAG: RtcB family protein [candidate division KSB1 bacterium]|nr:RtcB family protein [candidate division KSB1 bacterium]